MKKTVKKKATKSANASPLVTNPVSDLHRILPCNAFPPDHTTAKPETILVLRFCDSDMTSSHGFKWPKSGPVECTDWVPAPPCGHGLHGWAKGVGDINAAAKSPDDKSVWLVVEVVASDVVDLGGKVKFPRGVVVYSGERGGAVDMIMARHPSEDVMFSNHGATGYRGTASATGDGGTASATGYGGTASATGYGGTASATGYGGTASATGYRGTASAMGDGGTASATGYRGTASATGDGGTASATGYRGTASATGDGGTASATGYRGTASATGVRGTASATGYGGTASATGYRGTASATGYGGTASATGKHGRADARDGIAMAGEKGILSIAWWDIKNDRCRIAVAYVGEDGILPDVKYRFDVKTQKFVEVPS